MTEARFQLNEHTTRVLDVIKGKYGLKNRNDALNKFFQVEGDKYVEQSAREQTLRELDLIYTKHMEKNANRKMTDTELKKLLGL